MTKKKRRMFPLEQPQLHVMWLDSLICSFTKCEQTGPAGGEAAFGQVSPRPLRRFMFVYFILFCINNGTTRYLYRSCCVLIIPP